MRTKSKGGYYGVTITGGKRSKRRKTKLKEIDEAKERRRRVFERN